MTIQRLIAQEGFPVTGGVATYQMSGVDLVVLGPRQDTDPHQLDTPPAGEFHSVVLLMEVPLAMEAASVVPEWEVPGLSAHLPGAEAPDFAVAVLEAKDSQEGEVEVLQEEAAGVEDEGEGPDGVDIGERKRVNKHGILSLLGVLILFPASLKKMKGEEKK